MSETQRIDRSTDRAIIAAYLPLFAELERRGTDYCLVGGLAVLAHGLAQRSDRFRMTYDADILVSTNCPNATFAEAYLQAYATEPTSRNAIEEAAFGEGDVDALDEPGNAFANMAITGADSDIDGVETPNCDVCRMLNGRTLGSIERERLDVGGQNLWVATKSELLGMKHDTATIYGDMSVNPRPHDFIDMSILMSLMEGADHADHPNQDTHGGTMLSKVRRLLRGPSHD